MKDTLSNKLVFAGKSESANIFLELKHSQSGKTFVSSNQAASHYVDANGKPQVSKDESCNCAHSLIRALLLTG